MNKKIILTLIVFVLMVGLSAYLKTYAGTGQSGAGFPWGGSEDSTIGGVIGSIDGNETGLGWISMNSANCDSDSDGITDIGNYPNCPTGLSVTDYGVSIPSADGNLSGYAWSENIGWISFNSDDLTGCPFGACTARRVTTPADHLEGWARIVGIKTEFEAVPSNSGGWLGWIKMKGRTSDGVDYGVVINPDGTTFKKCDNVDKSCAWSDELGWIDFSKAKRVTPTTLKVCQNSCDSGSEILNGSTIAFTTADPPKNLKACYNTDPSCGILSGDVTAIASWNEINGTPDAVSATGTNPKVLIPNSVSAISTDTISVTYNGNVTFAATVTPVKDCYYCDVPAYQCTVHTYSGTSICNNLLGRYNIDDGLVQCQASCVKPPTGTNWREVAP